MRLVSKIMMVVAMTIAILVPLMMISGMIDERQMYRMQAVEWVASTSAGAQALSGPVLIVPYVETIEVEEKNDKGAVIRKIKQDGEAGTWIFFASDAKTTGKLVPKSRFRGLHEVRTYQLEGRTTADFKIKIPVDANPNLARKIGKPWLSYGIGDVRGLNGIPRLLIDGKEHTLQRGFGGRNASGLHVRLDNPKAGDEVALKTVFDFVLTGTESLAVVPLAEQNRVILDSAWKHPQFNGSFTTREHAIGDNGFHAEWEVSSVATNAQAQFLAGKTMPSLKQGSGHATLGRHEAEPSTDMEMIGVSLVDPVNVYSQADRATKYGILFVLLTFVGFFMFELIKQLRIHPIQYGLVGLALAIFFLLLLALSEHIAFGLAYLIASLACLGLLGYYVGHILHSWRRGAGFAMMLGLLYVALYGLLILEDRALVVGAGLLFAILAAIMIVTRKVDWYRVGATTPVPPLP